MKNKALIGWLFILGFFLLNTRNSACIFNSNIKVGSAATKSQISAPDNFNNGLYYLDRNPVNLSFLYTPSKMGLKGLSNFSGFFSYKFSDNHLIAISGSGNNTDLFKRFGTGIHFAHDLDKLIQYNISFYYQNISIKNFNSYDKIQFDIGANLPLGEYFDFAFFYRNINRSYFESNDDINQEAIFSLSSTYFNNFSLDLNSYLDLDKKWSFGLSCSYKLEEILKLYAACKNHPNQFESGLEINVFENNSIGLRFLQYSNISYNWSILLGISI